MGQPPPKLLVCSWRFSSSCWVISQKVMQRPCTSGDFSAAMAAAGVSNATLLRYVFPEVPFSGQVQDHWVPYTSGCAVARDCWCFHVSGDMTKSLNPGGWKNCARLSQLESCSSNSMVKVPQLTRTLTASEAHPCSRLLFEPKGDPTAGLQQRSIVCLFHRL